MANDQVNHDAIMAEVRHVGTSLTDFRKEVHDTHEKMWKRMNASGEAFSVMAEANKAVVGKVDDHEQRIRANEGFRIMHGSQQTGERGVIGVLRDWLAVCVAVAAALIAYWKAGT